LGWDDGAFLAPKVKGMAYDYYAKCEEKIVGVINPKIRVDHM
jgi:hypothetical protein